MVARNRDRRHASFGAKGFTLIELVVVMVVMVLLAGLMVGRFSDRAPAAVLNTADQLVSALRTAQSTAIAQRRTVCVDLQQSPAAMSVSLGSAAGCSAPLTPPGGGAWLSDAGGLQLDVSRSLRFGPDGTPQDASGAALAAAVQIQVRDSSGTVTSPLITVEPVSGHVHAP